MNEIMMADNNLPDEEAMEADELFIGVIATDKEDVNNLQDGPWVTGENCALRNLRQNN